MFNTIAAIIVAISLVLPGFIVADLAEARRAQRSARSDWELVLRALIYALVLQSLVLLSGWTTQLIDTAGLLKHAKPGMTPTWEHHVHAIALYVMVVILLAPTVIGLALGWVLRRAESRGSLTWIHYALGGRNARDAWDYIFQRYGAGFILVHLKPGHEQRNPFIVGKFGRTSWAAQTPTAARDVYFQEVWPASADGQITEEFAVRRGVWLDSSQIDAMFFIEPRRPATFPPPCRGVAAPASPPNSPSRERAAGQGGPDRRVESRPCQIANPASSRRAAIRDPAIPAVRRS